MNANTEIKIEPLSFIIHNDSGSHRIESQDQELKLYAGRFYFGSMQKDFFFQAPNGCDEKWKEACNEILSGRAHYPGSRAFVEDVYETFICHGFQPIAK